jgi:hypothetical protein
MSDLGFVTVIIFSQTQSGFSLPFEFFNENETTKNIAVTCGIGT